MPLRPVISLQIFRCKPCLTIACLCVAAATCCPAQSYRFDRYTTDNGLISNAITAMLEDRDGFHWFASSEGISRFDGYSFHNFRHHFNDSTSLPGGYTPSMAQDSSGKIWIAASLGLTRFDPKTERFKHFRHAPDDPGSISSQFATAVFCDSKNRIWVGARGAAWNLFDPKTETFKRFAADTSRYPNLRNATAIAFAEDADGSLWMLSQGHGFVHFDPESGQQKWFFLPPSPEGEPLRNLFTRLWLDREARVLWLSVWARGVWRFDLKTNALRQFKYHPKETADHNVCLQMLPRDSQSLWLMTGDSGLMVLNYRLGKFSSLTPASTGENDFKPGLNECLLLDRSGDLWAGGHGIHRLHAARGRGFLWSKTSATHQVLQAIPMPQQAGKWLLGTFREGGGFGVFDEKTGQFRVVPPLNGGQKLEVSDIFIDQQNNCWVSPQTGPVYRFDAAKNRLRPLVDSLKNIVSVQQDGAGNRYFLSGLNGVFWKQRAADGQLSRFSVAKILGIGFYALEMLCDAKNRLWVSSADGNLVALDTAGHLLKHYKPIAYGGVFPDKNILGLTTDAAGNIWFGTTSGLFWVENPLTKREQIHFFDDRNGFPASMAFDLAFDQRNTLWVVTNRGLLRFDPQLQKGELIRAAIDWPVLFAWPIQVDYLPETDELVLCSKGGFGRVRPLDFLPDSTHVRLAFTEFRVFDRDWPLSTAVNHANRIWLGPDENSFSISFAGLYFRNPAALEYAYRLEGVENQWVDCGQRRTVSYTQLPPGHYVFRARVKNPSGHWGEERQLEIVVAPHFWQTWWFRLAILGALMGAVWLFFKNRIAAARRDSDIRRRIAEAENAALRAQMNPHFIFNCLNTMDAMILRGDRAAASEFLGKFSKLIRQVLQNSRQPLVSLADDLQCLEWYVQLEKIRLDGLFDYKISLDERLQNGDFRIPPLLLQPFAENAILHGLRHKTGGDCLLEISLELENDGTIRACIRDNGIGRQRAAEINRNRPRHDSLGLAVTRDRLEMLENQGLFKTSLVVRDLFDTLGNAAGTEVFLDLKPTL